MTDYFPKATVSATSVLTRFKRVPETVRDNLRRDIPGVTKKLAARVRGKLAPGVLFKTTTKLLPAIKSEMVENAKQIVGRVYVDPGLFPSVIANTLESGAKAHVIAAKNAGSLFFFWEKLGKNVAFQSVNHPGFEGRSYMRSSLEEELPDIKNLLRRSVMTGVS